MIEIRDYSRHKTCQTKYISAKKKPTVEEDNITKFQGKKDKKAGL